MSMRSPTRLVSDLVQLDEGPAKIRIGLIELATGEAGEADFHRMLPPEVMFHTTRIMNVNPVTPENLKTMGPRLMQAAEHLLPGGVLDVIAYDCTSGTVMLGHDEIARQIHRARPGIPVVTPITAAIKALKRRDVRRISLVTPYEEAVNQPLADYIENAGIEVLSVTSFNMSNDVEMARLMPRAILEAVYRHQDHAADAVFISCTAIRAVEIIEEAERLLGKPVISSIQCLFWDALRTGGYRSPLIGFGSLLRE